MGTGMGMGMGSTMLCWGRDRWWRDTAGGGAAELYALGRALPLRS